MSTRPKILAFAGSLRRDSFNKKLVSIAAQRARDAGGDVTLIDLREFALPVYDGDLEKSDGLPPNAKKLRELMLQHHAILVASPEYNSSITGVLKNTIDWMSRNEKAEGTNDCFQGKVGGVMGASPGAFGALRSVATLRALLAHLGVLVVPEQTLVPKAHEAFAADGSLKDERTRTSVEKVAQRVVLVTSALLAAR